MFESRARAGDLTAAADLARNMSVVWSHGQRAKDWVVGRGDPGVLRLVRGAEDGTQVIAGLRAIERYEGGRRRDRGLAAIFAALLSSDRGCAEGHEQIEGAPAFFAKLAEEREEVQEESWTEARLAESIRDCINSLVEGGGLYKPKAGALDSARFWIGMGEQLWNPEVRKRLSRAYPEAATRRILMMLAGSWMELKPEGWVLVRGSNFRLRGNARRMAWPQVMEWEAGEVGRRALKYMTGYHTTFAFDGVLTGLLGNETGKAATIAPQVAARESKELLEEAALNWTCDPFGSFRVDLPECTPLERWNVSSLRVWIIPGQGLWVALEKDEQPGASLKWLAGPPHLRRWVLHEKVIPAMHLTMSALWRDLKIGGKEVILAENGAAVPGDEEGDKKLRLHGRIRWGSEAELKRILRKAYPVEGHIRVLPPGKRATGRAYRLAMSQGIMLQPGTTFVRSHQRGKPDVTAANVPLRAQGLARLILASRTAV